ncbi:MAG: 5'-3' exonuclease H3TH domain-containing protein [Halieaceae bacterium]
MTAPNYLVDASIYIFRAYFSLPERWHSPEGYPLNAVYGYTSFLLDLFDSLGAGPHSLACAFDESLGSCFRNDIYPDYKSSRELPDEALAYQLEACRQVSELLAVPCFSGSRHEADDYIATLATLGRQGQQPAIIVSRDKDLGQLLLAEGDRLWDFAAGVSLDAAGFEARFGVEPQQFPDYQGLVGDPVDDIPGVPAIGAKSGALLIRAHGNLETLAQQRHQLLDLGLRGAARISNNLENHWDAALLSRELARLDTAVPGVSLPEPWQLRAESLARLVDYLESIELRGGVLNRARRLLADGVA